MELNENLVKLQGTLYSFGMQGFLNNADTTDKVIKGFKEIIDNLPNDEKAKVAYFMVLRTDFSIFEDLQNDEFIGHFITAAPDFEKEYLVTYIYHLNIQSELFKVIENCPASLGVELLAVIVKKLREPSFHNDQFGYEHIFQLWKSVFVKLCKLRTGIEESAMKFANFFTEITHLIRDILVTLMSVKKFEEVLGFNLYHFFKSIMFFINLQKSPNVSDDPLYKFSFEHNHSEETSSNNFMTSVVNNVFKEIPTILNHLTIDMWMSFSEVNLDSNSKNSVQLLIGDLVYQIYNELNKKEKNYDVSSDVLCMLSTIAINKSDIIAKVGIDEIISNVQNGDVDSFVVLVRHPDFTKEKSVKCVIDNLELATSEDLNLILNTLYEYLCNNEQNEEMDFMKKLFLTALKKESNYLEWLEKIFEKYQPTLLTTATTHEELIETFNKISKDNPISDSDLVALCLQSPVDTIKKICQISVHGSEKTESTIRILQLLKPACNVTVSENFVILEYVLLKCLLDELTDKEKTSFINLIIQLGKEKLLEHSFFNNLLRSLKENLEKEIPEKAVHCLEVINAVLVLKIFPIEKAPFLVFMSQVLGHFSWSMKTFSVIKADGRDLVCSIITSVINELGGNDDFNFQWTQREIQKLDEINQACFCDVWFKFNFNWSGSGNFHSCILALAYTNQKSNEIRKFLVDLNEPNQVRASTILSLAMLLPVLTFREWNLIFHQLVSVWQNFNSQEQAADVHHSVLDQFGSSLQLVSINQKENFSPCYEYCLRNFGKLVKQTCSKLSEKSLLNIFEKIFILVGMLEEEEIRKSCWEIFSPVLMGLVERLKKKNFTEAHKTEIEKLLTALDLKNMAEALLKTLQ